MIGNFLKESPLAGDIRVDANVVVHRRELTSGEAERIGREGMNLSLSEERLCELEVNGLVLAEGRIVKKRGKYYFKVTRMEKGGPDGQRS